MGLRSRLGNPFGGPNGRVRRRAYGSMLAMIAVYAAIYIYTERGEAVLARSYCYTVLGMLYLIAGNNIRATTQYHPAYRWEKRLGGVGFMGLGASTAVGLIGNTVFLWLWLALLLLAQLISLEFILFRNASMQHQYLRTIEGPMPYPSSQGEADAIVDRACAILRHHLSSEALRASVAEALEFPTRDEQERDLRRQVRERREAAMEEAAMAGDVEAESWG